MWTLFGLFGRGIDAVIEVNRGFMLGVKFAQRHGIDLSARPVVDAKQLGAHLLDV